MSETRIVVTGASGFIGRVLLDGLKRNFEIMGMARRSQLRCGAPFHDNISWFQVDVGDPDTLEAGFDAVRASGGADVVIHLAAHYDFTGEDHPEYWRTNVEGLRNVLEQCRSLDLERFFFASSVAACQFPSKGQALTEDSPPDGEHIYAVTKRIGEEMLAEYDDIPSCIVRFAAMFSDWCEYAPLYFFLETWLSNSWNSKVIGGRGQSAIPYMHIRELPLFFRRLLERRHELEQREVVIASPNITTNHIDLFHLAHANFDGMKRRPWFMPSPLCVLGVWGRDLLGRMLGNRPFERPWMVEYIDADLAVDASKTHRRLEWTPRERLLVTRRIPFMVEHMKTDPDEWQRRNIAAMKDVVIRSNLRLHRLLEKHHDQIRSEFVETLQLPELEETFPSYRGLARDLLEWRFTIILRHLLNSVRTEEKGIFTAYCRDLAGKRFEEGFGASEIVSALERLDAVCMKYLRSDEESEGLDQVLHDDLSMTIQFGCDQVMETFEDLSGDYGLGAE